MIKIIYSHINPNHCISMLPSWVCLHRNIRPLHIENLVSVAWSAESVEPCVGLSETGGIGEVQMGVSVKMVHRPFSTLVQQSGQIHQARLGY